jgi:hypothetical protein
MRKAMEDSDGPLKIIPESFSVRTCQGTIKPFRTLTTWELLNLRPETVLDMPERLHDEFGITPDWLERVLLPYSIETLGKDALERYFHMDEQKPGQYFISSTRHYSWPKAAGK